MNYISTSKFAKDLKIPAKDLFSKFLNLGMITVVDGKKKLTEKGIELGGKYMDSAKFGEYIAWPETLELPVDDVQEIHAQSNSLNSTTIGKTFSITATKVNAVMAELGWIKKALKGWTLTPQGLAQGGIQTEHSKSGVPSVRWPATILESNSFKSTVAELTGSEAKNISSESPKSTSTQNDFRSKFPAEHRTTDGHMVRSKAEMLIDNWLYMAGIVHAYERKLPIEEDVYCDFYIPTGNVYIEYWGYENDPKYLARKKKKLEIYNKYGFHLIELCDEEVQNLDDHLPRLLLKFDVKAY